MSTIASEITRTGTVLEKANRTDPESQLFSVREHTFSDGTTFCEFYSKSFSKYYELPANWLGSVKWDKTH